MHKTNYMTPFSGKEHVKKCDLSLSKQTSLSYADFEKISQMHYSLIALQFTGCARKQCVRLNKSETFASVYLFSKAKLAPLVAPLADYTNDHAILFLQIKKNCTTLHMCIIPQPVA